MRRGSWMALGALALVVTSVVVLGCRDDERREPATPPAGVVAQPTPAADEAAPTTTQRRRVGPGRSDHTAGPEPTTTRDAVDAPETIRVIVIVTDPGGDPLEGVLCCAARDRESLARTDETGLADVIAQASGVRAGVLSIVACLMGSDATARAGVPVPGGAREVEATLTLDPGPGPFVGVEFAGPITPGDRVLLLGYAGDEGDPSWAVGTTGASRQLLLSMQGLGGVRRLRAVAAGLRVAEATVVPAVSDTSVVLRLEPGGIAARGRVLEPDGSPAAGALVGPLDDALEEGAVERTDADGSFAVRPEWLGQEIVALRFREDASAPLCLDDGLTEAVLQLGAGATITGVVREPQTGRALPDAEVVVLVGRGRSPTEWRVATDAGGTYRQPGLPPGVVVRARVVGTARVEPVDAADDRLIEVQLATGDAHRPQPGETITHDLVARRRTGGVWVFRLRDPDGRPVTGQVLVTHSFETATSRGTSTGGVTVGEDGSFERFLPSGRHTLLVSAPGLTGTAPDLVIAGDSARTEMEIVLRRRRRVIARLVDESGARVERAGVGVRIAVGDRHGGSGHGGGETDAHGEVDLTDEAPAAESGDGHDAYVSFTLDGEGLYGADPFGEDANRRIDGATWRDALRSGDDTPYVVDVPALGYRIRRIDVVGTDGRPVAGVPLRVRRSFADPWIELESSPPGQAEIEVRSYGGSLDIETLAPWSGRLAVHDAGHRSSRSPLRLVVARLRRVGLRLVDGEGVALHDLDVLIDAEWESGHLRPHTDAAGRVEIDAPDRAASARVGAEGFWGPRSIHLPVDAREVEVRMERLRRVVFRITRDEAARAVGQVWVEAQSDATRTTSACGVIDAESVVVEVALDLPRRRLPIHVVAGDGMRPVTDGVPHADIEYDGESDVVEVVLHATPNGK